MQPTAQAVGRRWKVLQPQRGERLVATQSQECPLYTDYFLFSILAQVSFRATVRLKTGFPGAESGSTQKYPSRSNWKRLPAVALASDGSSLASVRISSEFGLRFAVKSCPSSV